jgi:hypothetical protein
MERRNFFKKLFLGAAVIVTAPKILAKRPYVKPEIKPLRVDINRLPNGMTAEDFVKEWRQTGMLVYKEQPDDIVKIVSGDGTLYIKRHPLFEG